MKLEMREHSIVVIKEPGDPRGSGMVNAAGESRLLHLIKQQLNSQGYDLIKKRMWKDGHMVADMQQYLRTRKPSGDPMKDLYIYNESWATEGAEANFNQHGRVVLRVVRDVFNP